MRPFRWLLLPAALLLLFAGVACGDDSESDAAAVPEDGSASADATAEGGDDASDEAATSSEGPIRIGFSAWPGWFPWQVTEEQGFFEEAGVDVELVWFEGYLDSINAFAAGQLDGNSQTLNDTLASVAVGDEQVIVLTNDNSTGNDQIIVAEGIERIEDLAGKTIAVEVGVVDHFLLLLGLDSVGLSEADVDLVNLETGAAAAAFASGQVDAVGAFAPFTTTALQREGSSVLFTSADFPGAIPDHLALSRDVVEQRPEDVQKIVDAWYMTLDWMEANPDEALAILAERAGVSEEEYRSYEAGTTLFSVEDNLAALEPGDDFTSLHYAAEQIADFLVASEFVETRPELDGVFDGRFVEDHAERAGE